MRQLNLFPAQVTDYLGRGSRFPPLPLPTAPQTCALCGTRLPKSKTKPFKYCKPCGMARRLAQNRKWKHGNRDRNAAHQRKWGAANREQQRCNARYGMAVRTGRLLPPSRCLDCGTTIDLQAHHPDYRYAYRTVPLCRACHAEHHRAVRAREINDYPIACIKPQWTEAGAAWAAGNGAAQSGASQ